MGAGMRLTGSERENSSAGAVWRLAGAVALGIASLLFAQLSSELVENELTPLDTTLARAVHRLATPWLTWVMLVVTWLASEPSLGALTLGAVVIHLRRGSFAAAGRWAIG